MEATLRARAWLGVAAAAIVLAGCGGGDGGGDRGKRATAPGAPKPKESLRSAADKLAAAVKKGDCRSLAPLMLHSVKRGSGVAPDRPPKPAECRGIEIDRRNELAGFRPTKLRELGPVGFVEGSGDRPMKGNVVGTIWALDVDRSWKVVFDARFRPQVGLPPTPGDFAGNARQLVTALTTKDCDAIWRLVNPASRFVATHRTTKRQFCAGIRKSYAVKGGGFADLATDRGAQPRYLGRVRDVGFFGLHLRSGRYLVLALAGPFGDSSRRELRQHAYPSAIELVTVRPPG